MIQHFCQILVFERVLDVNYQIYTSSNFPGSSPVQNLSVRDFNQTAFVIIFTSPSAPSGIIDHYEIDVGNALDMPSTFTITVDNSSTTNQFGAIIPGLCE